MSGTACKHPDIRKFDGIRCCLACGEAVLETLASNAIEKNVDATGRHVYTHLNYQLGQEVRLILLAPGGAADPLCCEIVHVNLEDDPEYDAVSYTWATEDGNADMSKTIDCFKGGYIPITTNCDAVLRQLRRPGTRRRLWIDAICIDQSHVSERNHQVGIMDFIYSRARKVCICIPNPSLPVYWTEHGRLLRWPDYGRLIRWLRTGLPDTPEDVKETLFTDMQQLFSTRYFSRVWVIQEVALARVAYLIVNDEELLLTSTVLDRLSLLCAESRHCKLPGVFERLLVQDTRPEVLSCLYTGWQCLATDRRDCVFAVLSLMPPEIRSLIPVDYSMSLKAVIANAVVAIIATQRNLDILSLVKSPLVESFTSGVTDLEGFGIYLAWSVNGRNSSHYRLLPVFEGQQIGPWQADIDLEILPPSSTLHLDQHQGTSCVVIRPTHLPKSILPHLLVRAHYIDRVIQSNVKVDFKGVSQGAHQNLLLLKRHQYEQIVQFFRADVMMGDQSLHSGQEPYDKSVSIQDDKSIVLADLLKFIEIYKDAGQERPLYLSQYSVLFASFDYHGSFLVMPGDEIFAIDGAQVPFVLRKTITEQYILISPCYLWAALELDCWNPGTKKGRWGPDVERPMEKQTRMIEIF